MSDIQGDKEIHPFVHLHVHTHYSLLDGMSTIPGIVDKSIRSGMKAIAVTDHGNMFGIKEFLDYVNKKNKGKAEAETFKPIVGVEAYCARRALNLKTTKEDGGGWHLILLAKNKRGYQNLCKLVSISWIDGYYYKPRIDKELLEKYHEGIIVCSACLGGEIPQKLIGGKYQIDEDTQRSADSLDLPSINISEANILEAEKSVEWFKNIFGNDFYLELQRHPTNTPGGAKDTYRTQIAVNQALLTLAEKTQTKYICTNDVHFVEEEHADAHDRLICLSTGKDLDDPNRMRYTQQEWLKTPEEMTAIFGDLPEALLNTLEIANKIEHYSIDSAPLMPVFSIPETFATEETYRQKYTEQALREDFNKDDPTRFDKLGGYDKVLRIKYESDYLRKLTYDNASKRYGENIAPEIIERIEFELETMKNMGFPGYFLIVQDFIQAARDMGVAVGPGRGSAAGSVVAYCLGITDIDPLKYDLLFERFLNPDRISLPDIDIDFDDDGRMDVLRWVMDKYGKERVAHIITYGTMAAKSAIKDVARVQKLPLSEAERLTKLLPDRLPEGKDGKALKVNISNCLQHVPELQLARNSPDQNLSTTLKYAEILEGTVRQIGVHACGVIIGADDLTNFVPLSTAKEKGSDEDVRVTQYEGSVIESIGLIKMDFLGLKTLSIIKEALSNIKKSKGITIDISTIPIDDASTYELYSRGQTVGTFQFESAGMQKYLRELKPTTFEDLIAMNALYRPGPMAYIPDFIDRKHGRKAITYDLPEMEPRLKDTYGITVYQEQVMLLSRDLAGFTRGQSDELRKAMGKKLKDKMEALHEKFIAGAMSKGFDRKILEKIWSDWAKFAEYAFNKSHATCYSWVSYQTAYLKANYPGEFMAANLTRNKDDIGEITKFMDECKAMGITVKGPDVNESDMNFTVNKAGDIRFGLGGVKGVGGGAVEAIIREREQSGPFKGIFDFVERVSLTACNKKAIEALCLSGAFDNFPEARREQYFADNAKGEAFIESLIRYGNKYQMDKNSASNSLFGGFDSIDISKPEIPAAESWSSLEKLSKEKDLVGIFLSSHPLDDFYVILNYVCNTTMKDLSENLEALNGRNVTMGGIVAGFREGFTKRGTPYGILKLDDYTGSAEIPLFGDAYIKFANYCRPNMYLFINGKVQPKPYNEREYEIRIASIQQLPEIKDQLIEKISIEIDLEQIDDEMVTDLSALLKNSLGNTVLFFKVFNPENNTRVSLKGSLRVDVSRTVIDYLEKKGIRIEVNK
jgi:DNA polymerase-3 subunit alpha